MKLTQEAINEYRQIHKKEFQQEINLEDAEIQAQKVLQFFKVIFNNHS
ncbi:hypothetical protein HON22_03945 [Candidatus Peregrinibacteria bacterium]|jgi:hypothetical protein|nr:hypothetical protein [Candidatus Peregrinibacteria bacterium]